MSNKKEEDSIYICQIVRNKQTILAFNKQLHDTKQTGNKCVEHVRSSLMSPKNKSENQKFNWLKRDI